MGNSFQQLQILDNIPAGWKTQVHLELWFVQLVGRKISWLRPQYLFNNLFLSIKESIVLHLKIHLHFSPYIDPSFAPKDV